MSVIPQKKLFADEPKSGKGTKRSLDESEDVGEEDVSETDKKPSAKEQHHAPPSEHDESKTATPTATTSLPARPIKKARTAYFIFADDKRAEIQAKNPGAGVAVIARATGQMWSALSDEEKLPYQVKAAEERERVSKEIAKYNLDDLRVSASNPTDPLALSLPTARVRKICKLDPEVKNLSREALLLIAKCTEMVTAKLGGEAVKVARLQNRRTLLPDDVAQICGTKEQFLFLREDIKDMVREQLAEKKSAEKEKAKAAEPENTKPLTDYFSKQSS